MRVNPTAERANEDLRRKTFEPSVTHTKSDSSVTFEVLRVHTDGCPILST
jgi:hypothetical protein